MSHSLPPAALPLAASLLLLPATLPAQVTPGQPLQEIIVTADPREARTPGDLVSPVTVLSGAELARRQAPTLGELLDGLPGVSNSSFGPGVGRPVVRGLQGSRVQVLEDGLPVGDVSGEGADHAIGIDTSRATQVEVFRGPAVLLYGSGAAGGLVNVRSNRHDPELRNGPWFTGQASYGENGNDRQGSLGIELPAGNFALRADGSRRRTKDFSIDGFQQVGQTGGRRDRLVNSSIETDAWSVGGIWSGPRGYLSIGYSGWETDYGIPENFDARPRNIGGQSDDFERVFADFTRIDLRGELREPVAGIEVARLKLAWTEFEQQEVEFKFDRTPAGGDFREAVVEADFANDQLDLRLELVHVPIGGLSGVFGFQYGDRDFVAGDPRGADRNYYIRPVTTRNFAMFLLEELPTAFGSLEFSARIERERSSPDAIVGDRVTGVTGSDGAFIPFPEQADSRSFWPVSLSAGALVDLGAEYRLRASVTRAERTPSPEQLYAFGRHAAAGTFEIGDTRLGKETYLNLEIGLDRRTGQVLYQGALFYNRVDDFIYLRSEDDGTGAPVFVNDIGNRAGEGATLGCAPGDGGLCRLRNQLVFSEQADAEFYGAEFNAVASLLEGPTSVALRFGGDYVRGKLRGGNGNLPRITPKRAGAGIDVSHGNVVVSTDLSRIFGQSRTAEAETSTGSFYLLSFDIEWQPDVLAGASLFLRGRNLLNEDGRLHQSFFKDQAPIIGRAFFAGARFEFGG
ncbi:MAG: TonB-dependent receptor [Chromatiales bacterium]|nr:TonB-dependent receptor [Chromatiales bacterium]